jgi:hypothetical protein
MMIIIYLLWICLPSAHYEIPFVSNDFNKGLITLSLQHYRQPVAQNLLLSFIYKQLFTKNLKHFVSLAIVIPFFTIYLQRTCNVSIKSMLNEEISIPARLIFLDLIYLKVSISLGLQKVWVGEPREAPKSCESHKNTAASHFSQKSFYYIKYVRAIVILDITVSTNYIATNLIYILDNSSCQSSPRCPVSKCKSTFSPQRTCKIVTFYSFLAFFLFRLSGVGKIRSKVVKYTRSD